MLPLGWHRLAECFCEGCCFFLSPASVRIFSHVVLGVREWEAICRFGYRIGGFYICLRATTPALFPYRITAVFTTPNDKYAGANKAFYGNDRVRGRNFEPPACLNTLFFPILKRFPINLLPVTAKTRLHWHRESKSDIFQARRKSGFTRVYDVNQAINQISAQSEPQRSHASNNQSSKRSRT